MAKEQIPSTPIKNPLSRLLVLGVSSGLGLGYFPKAPGTAGSLLGLLLGWATLKWSLPTTLAVFVFLFFIFSWFAQRACRHWGELDAQRIVSDEVLGQAIAFMAFRQMGGVLNLEHWLLAFVLFRAFDIAKPFPARSFDRRVKNGYGVMLDDVVAGLYAAISLHFYLRIH